MATQRQELITSNQSYSLAPRSFEEAERLANIIANSGICPSSLKGRPSDVLVILQMGHELRLQPMQALRTLGCINGLPFAYGDGFLALIKRHSDFLDIKEWMEGDIASGDATAYCTMTRRGQEPQTRSFSIKDAIRAGLWKKAGTWTQYPQRMLQHRARTYCGKDVFPDAVFGLMTEDEVRGMPVAIEAPIPQSKGLQGLKETLSAKIEPEISEANFEVMTRSEEDEALINELLSLIIEKNIPDKSQEKWKKKFNVDVIEDIPIEGIKKIINHIKEKM